MSEPAYTTQGEIRLILLDHMSAATWWSPAQLYELVEHHASLKPADWEPDAPGSTGVRWHRNVRNALQRLKSTNDVEWNSGEHIYRLTTVGS